tara:strand:+ start:298 stop:516 length:219 start_codon:yes stop_codon:yes gene_type:complete
MIYFKKLTKDYEVEISVIEKYRDYSDGITFFDFFMNWDRFLADHSPQFNISIFFMNYAIFDFNIYYLHHRDE